MLLPPLILRSILFALLMLSAGCEHTLTGKLWNSDGFAHFRAPAPEPQVAVFYAPAFDDFVVGYDSVRDGGEVPRRQSYFAVSNERNLWYGKMPQLISTNELNLIPVPLNGNTNVLPHATYDRSLTIYTKDDRFGPYPLPTYKETEGIAAKVALTPLTVTGDATVAAVILGFMTFIAWCESGFQH